MSKNRFARLAITLVCIMPLLALSCRPGETPSAPRVTSDTKATESPDPVADGRPIFEDLTAASGIAFTYHNGEDAGYYSIVESMGGGVGLLDYNRDGLLDIYLTGGGEFGTDKTIRGRSCKIYRNEGGWRFRDVTAEAGLDGALFYSHGCAVADYDNNRWPDLLVTGYGRLALYRNREGRFEEVTRAAGLLAEGTEHWSTSAGWGDVNGDGFADLFVVQYLNWSWANDPLCKDPTGARRDVCTPRQLGPMPHFLYLNNGDGTFRDASQQAAIKPGKGLGVLIVDLNHDGRPDIYVANDTGDNYLYLNQGGGRLTEVGMAMAVARDEKNQPNGSMGVDAADYDGSGHLSLFVTNYQYEAHALYRNSGRGPFYYASHGAGITAIGLNYVGFGTVFLDYDLDGDEDLVFANGHAVRYPAPPATLKQRPVLLRNLRKPGDRPHEVRFVEASSQGGPYFQVQRMGRGVALGDLDNDGKTDLVINHTNEPAVLLRNVAETPHHWLGISLAGKNNREVVGAELTLEVGDRKLVRAVKGGGSYMSSGDRRVIFGLGDAKSVGRLTVRWPWGETQTWDGLTPGRYWRLVEGERDPSEH